MIDDLLRDFQANKIHIAIQARRHYLLYRFATKTDNPFQNIILLGDFRLIRQLQCMRQFIYGNIMNLDIRTPFKEVMQCIIENAYSRIPIYSGSRDNIKGSPAQNKQAGSMIANESYLLCSRAAEGL